MLGVSKIPSPVITKPRSAPITKSLSRVNNAEPPARPALARMSYPVTAQVQFSLLSLGRSVLSKLIGALCVPTLIVSIGVAKYGNYELWVPNLLIE